MLPGLLTLEAVSADPAPARPARFEGRPPTLSAPAVRPAIPTSAPVGSGTRAGSAKDSAPRELTGLRDAVTTTWANGDGTRTVRIHAEPVHYRRAHAQGWERIDNTLVPDPQRKGWVRNAANAWTGRFGPVGSSGAGGVELVTDAGTVRFAPELDQETEPITPSVHANTVTYRGVWPGVDLVYTVSGGAVKEDIVVHRPGRTSFPFLVDGLGLTRAGGSLAVTGAQADELRLAPPEVLDGGGRLAGKDASPTLAAGAAPGGRQRLTVAVDRGWLARELATGAGPVVIDPTVVIGDSVHQSFKSDGLVASQDGIRIGNSQGAVGGGDSYWRSVAAFPYWSSLSGKQLVSASMQLGVAQGTTTAYPVSAWWACGADYNGAVCGGDAARRYATADIAGGVTLDVSTLVGTWHYFGVQNGVFGFSGANTPGVYTYKRLHPPTLVLTVNSPPPAPGLVAPADGALAITSMTPTLKWNPVTDPDGDAMDYTAKIATGPDGESGLVAASPATAATSWPVPAGVLRDGVTYYWKVVASDGHASKASAVRRITADRRLGAGAVSPTDPFGGVTTNLVTGNAMVQVPAVELPTIGGGIGVGFAYNSHAVSGGLLGEYRIDADRDTVIDAGDPVALARADAQISFAWTGTAGDATAESPSPGVPAEWYSVRWRGFVALPAGQWQLGARSDDGVRVSVDGVTVLDKWQQRLLPAEPDFQSGGVAGGAVRRITVAYFQATGPAAIELWARNAADPGQAFVIPASWLSAEPNILPRGWSLQATDAGALYTRVEVSDGSVTLTAPDGSATSFAKTAFGLAYAPPPGVTDVVVVNADGTVTVQAGDGRTYVFRADGGLDKITSALDDQAPATPNAGYDPVGRLTALTDPVSGRSVTLTYAPNPACPQQPPVLGGDTYGPPPSGMLCKVDYWDGTATQLYYKNELLVYVRHPGDAYWGHSYDTTGRLVGYHTPVMFDAALSVRNDWDRLLVAIAYDGAGRVGSVTLPPPNQGDPRPARAYGYAPTINANGELTGGTATVTRSGVAGAFRTVAYDARGRGTQDANALGQTATTTWNARDLVTSAVDSTGLKSTFRYDALDQPIDEWGPAPPTMFNPDGTGQSGVPRQTTRYDEGIDGLAVQWWANATMTGAPARHAHDPGPLSSDWGSGSPAPGLPADNFSGRYTGHLTFAAAGTYTLRFVRDNKLAVYLGDVIHLHKWENTTSNGDDVSVSIPAAGTVKRLRIDYAETSGPARLQMLWKAPGASAFVTVPGSALRTGYGLATSTVDAAGRVSASSYADGAAGIGVQHGIRVRSTADPGGASLTETTGYEAVGAGFLRQVSRTLPAGAATTTTTTYYGAAEPRDNPCTTAADAAHQGGLARLERAADPDGTGPQTPIVRERVHDAAGRPVATRVGSEPWTCTAYDTRGRVIRVDHPAFGGQPSRTVTYNHHADPDGAGSRPASPLVTSVSDAAGTVVIEVDLLGRPTSHRDVFGHTTTYTYDLAGRETASVGPAGTIEKTYDAGDRLTSVKRGGLVLAEGFAYDAAGRLTAVFHPSGTGKAGNNTLGVFDYDTLGRPSRLTWFGPNWTVLTSDEVTRDLGGDIVGQVIDGADHHAGDDYRYDSTGRLVEAWVPGAAYTYEFFENGFCPAPGAHRNGNRTTMTVTPTGGGAVSTAYCYDHADRLVAATDSTVGSVTYDAHGNTAGIFGEAHVFDAADRHVMTVSAADTVSYVRDALDRIVERRVNGVLVARYGYTGSGDTPMFLTGANNVVTEVTYLLPGGAMLTTRGTGNVWSYPNLHGDLVATANQSGVKQGGTTIYDPFGGPVSGTVPDNAAGGFDYGWVGESQRPLEHQAGFQPVIEMGARQYSPLLGRFLEVDPIPGAGLNDYEYATGRPTTVYDVDGLAPSACWWALRTDILNCGRLMSWCLGQRAPFNFCLAVFFLPCVRSAIAKYRRCVRARINSGRYNILQWAIDPNVVIYVRGRRYSITTTASGSTRVYIGSSTYRC
jgi:RHS repeat-associated protein